MSSTLKNDIISRAAEAIIYRDGDRVIKDRIKKAYRISEIDEPLRKKRTKTEFTLLQRAKQAKINVPIPYTYEGTIMQMEFLNGPTVKDILNNENYKVICEKIGKQLRKLHDEGITHGDLTTSNMIWLNNEVYFIDFGLGELNKSDEAKAVDLHLLDQVLEAKHTELTDAFEIVKQAYAETKVLHRLKLLKSRGRYKKREAL